MSQTTEEDTKNKSSDKPDGTRPESAPQDNTKKEQTPEERLAAVQKELDSANDRYLRSVADLENFRKRVVREKDEIRQYATVALMEELIPIMDNLRLGLAAAKQQTDAKAIAEGVGMVLDQLGGMLGRNGLKEINPAGEAFDPNQHDCISHQPSDTVAEEKIMEVVRRGYSLNGRLIRPASVVVSSGPAKKPDGKA